MSRCTSKFVRKNVNMIFKCLILNLLWKYTFSEYTFDIKYSDVPVDHFTIQNKTFKLRYLINGDYHVKGGPVFLYTGNEGNIFMFAQNTGFMFDIAPVFNALVVFIEHRYYGESLPFGNQSNTPENLRFLTSSQALADYVHVIEELRKTYFATILTNDTLPVVSFGGSYGGMLAAWLRMKYPTSVIGAIASSAPIWYFRNMIPCEKFYEIVTGVFEKFGTAQCTNIIKASWEILRNVTKTSSGMKHLYETWRICETFGNATDVEKLVDWLSDIYVNMAMTNYHYPTNFIVPLPAYPVKTFCDKLVSLNSTDPLSTLANLGKALTVYTNYTGSTLCNSINSTSKYLGEYTWDYQACTELVMPICSTNKDMFETQPWDEKKYSEECSKKYGVSNSRPDWIVSEYGGKNLKYFSNIVFSNGMMDPWSCGGVTTNISSNIWAVNITDGVHHSDLRSADPADTNYVIEARKFHVKSIKKWLNMF
ncbi:lysosomal Pro-X carboxypeptidase [Leptinotarsa decemlineata]|uniref:lysosomal Pro-X carboxypeptidase n=1 Tax=Leptinotarsa decemlineata TaxID=7539 RepID=UPI003D30B4D0